MGTNATVFDRLSALADATRSRLLLLLDGHELTVSELCAVLQLPQSTVSRHLKVLGDEGWVASRAEGTSRLYRMARDLAPAAAMLWQLVRQEAARAIGVGEEDAARLRSVLAERRSRSRAFFSTAAGSWDATKAELFGERPDLLALAGLLDPGWTVGDLGCGTAPLAVSVAPFVAKVIAVDESAAMLEAARSRVEAVGGAVELRQGVLESLPVGDGELDVALLSLVLHYVVEPPVALREAARALRPGGRVLVLDMLPHTREEYRERMGHVWPGFGAELLDWLAAAGFQATRYVPLPADARARGPRLFVATGTKGSGSALEA